MVVAVEENADEGIRSWFAKVPVFAPLKVTLVSTSRKLVAGKLTVVSGLA